MDIKILTKELQRYDSKLYAIYGEGGQVEVWRMKYSSPIRQIDDFIKYYRNNQIGESYIKRDIAANDLWKNAKYLNTEGYAKYRERVKEKNWQENYGRAKELVSSQQFQKTFNH